MNEIFVGATLEDALKNAGLEGEALENAKASVERYNELCAAGKDTDFGKPENLLIRRRHLRLELLNALGEAPVGSAVIEAARLDVAHVLAVHDGEVAHHLGLRVDRLAARLRQHEARERFVHEALAVAVHPQTRRGAPRAERDGGRVARNRAGMALDGAARPAPDQSTH